MELVIRDTDVRVITEKEAQIVKLLSEGMSATNTAIKLGMNRRTMEATIQRLKNKTDTKTMPHLIATFIRKKLID